MSENADIPRVLSIAGSDSGGGAGIQADLKAFAYCGVYGMTAVTAITAQNTEAVVRAEAVTPDLIQAQVRAVIEDIGVDAVKVGMLGSTATIEAVAGVLAELGDAPIVVDPVMVAESGARLLPEDAVEALVGSILPLATVLTPNIPEAAVLTGLDRTASQVELAQQLLKTGSRSVVVTGGHSVGLIDVFAEPGFTEEITGPLHPDGASHGSGCTHSSALAAGLARGMSPLEAARFAREVASLAVQKGLVPIGNGAGPVDLAGLLDRLDP